MRQKLQGSAAEQTACEACLLLNEAIREFIAPIRVHDLTKQWEAQVPLPIAAIAAVRNMVLRISVINLYRLSETTSDFLAGWLFSEEELARLGFKRVEDFIGRDSWDAFVTIRHQFAGHATGKGSTNKRPGRIIPPTKLAECIRRTRLHDLPEFLMRISDELLPGIESVRDQITARYPNAANYVRFEYPAQVDEDTKRVTSPKTSKWPKPV